MAPRQPWARVKAGTEGSSLQSRRNGARRSWTLMAKLRPDGVGKTEPWTPASVPVPVQRCGSLAVGLQRRRPLIEKPPWSAATFTDRPTGDVKAGDTELNRTPRIDP